MDWWMRLGVRLGLVCAGLVPSPTPIQKPDYIPQFVVLSFDGSRDLGMWRQTIDFAKQAGVKFTYFISGVYFLDESTKGSYTAPGQKSGDSKIGFGLDSQEISARKSLISEAILDGHEIGSHLNGHFDSSRWTSQEWDQEIKFFDVTIPDEYAIRGMRIPNLAFNTELWPIMKQHGYRYEAGQVGTIKDWPRVEDGVWKFPLPAIELVGSGKAGLTMDYNFYILQTNGKDKIKKGSAEWQTARQQIHESLLKYFRHNYRGNRAPVYWANHFSLWNGGVYWQAMQDFALEVCGLDLVRCVTYSEVVNYLDL